MSNKDLEEIAKLFGLRIEDLNNGNILNIQGSLMGISKLSPTSLHTTKEGVKQNQEENNDPDKQK